MAISENPYDKVADPIVQMTESVLEIASEGSFYVVFRHPDRNCHPNDRTESCYREFTMSRKDWEMLGCPSHITVSAKIGDTLNG